MPGNTPGFFFARYGYLDGYAITTVRGLRNMNVADAAFNVVHDARPDGSGTVANLLAKKRGTLDHEVRPPAGSSAKFGLLDAVKVTKYTGDHRILYAFAEECDHVCIPRPSSTEDGEPSTERVLTRASQLSRAIAKSFEDLNAALSDGRVSPPELAQIEADALDAIVAFADVVKATRSKMEGDLARHHAAVEAARRSGQ